jgi:hypothetical protein
MSCIAGGLNPHTFRGRYELQETGRMPAGGPAGAPVPDQYAANLVLQESVTALGRDLTEARSVAATASATWDRFRKERDFHRMHHKRVLQEKNRLLTDIERLKKHYSKVCVLLSSHWVQAGELYLLGSGWGIVWGSGWGIVSTGDSVHSMINVIGVIDNSMS